MKEKIVYIFNGVVFDEYDNILIDNRREEKLQVVNGKWELPGGKMEFGETPEETVKREVMEETGYLIEVDQILPNVFVNQWNYEDYKQHTVVFSYLCHILSKDCKESKDYGVNQIKWCQYEELKRYDFLPGTLKTIDEAIILRNAKQSYDKEFRK